MYFVLLLFDLLQRETNMVVINHENNYQKRLENTHYKTL